MDPGVDDLGAAIASRELRLAVFDTELREATGQWWLEESIPVIDLIEAVRTDDRFAEPDGTVVLPLHAHDAPDLTGDAVIVDPTETPPTVTYYDPGRGKRCQLSLDEFANSVPGWHVRFFTDAYDAGTDPAFLDAPEAESTTAADERVVDPDPAHDPDVEQFFERLRSALVTRQERHRERNRERYTNLGASEYIEEFGGITAAIPAGRDVDEYGQQRIKLRIDHEHLEAGVDTVFATGDEVLIDADAESELPVEAELLDLDSDTIELGIYWDSARGRNAEAVFDADSSRRLTVVRLVDTSRYGAMAAAIETVERTDRRRELLAGTATAAFASEPETLVSAPPINRDQAAAIRRAIATEDLSLIETPPWTGARRVLEHVIGAAIEADRRVLLLCPDTEALEGLLPSKAGDTSRRPLVDGDRFPDARVVRLDAGAAARPFSTAAVVGATPTDVGLVEDHSFDVAIVDQAARVSVPAGAIPFAKAGRVILCGDPARSPPSPVDRVADTGLATSIFAHLRNTTGAGCTVSLRRQYRMNQAIAQYPNRAAYDSQLLHGEDNRDWTIDALPPIDVQHVAGIARETPTGSVFNDAEVAVVREAVSDLAERGVSGSEIGVITESSAQIGKIRVAIEEACGDSFRNAVTVGGSAAFRCESRRAIVLSSVRTADVAAPPTRGFWTPEGLIAALTSAERRLVLVGDWTYLSERTDPGPPSFGQLATFLTDRGLLAADPD